jgi:hypothetical protein
MIGLSLFLKDVPMTQQPVEILGEAEGERELVL